jgi:peptidoglycan/LPS O-acetylase OafA/YrhL
MRGYLHSYAPFLDNAKRLRKDKAAGARPVPADDSTSGKIVTDQALRPHREDVPGLTGLRFVAAFSVLIAHGCSTLAAHETPLGWIYWVKQMSGFGMTLFFVLSGFVIHYNYAAMVRHKGLRGVGAYLWARFARLYPLFFLTLFVNVVVSSRFRDMLGGNPERFEGALSALPYFLTSTHSWVYVPIRDSALVYAVAGGSSITWSISTEWFFYFLYPCIAWLLLKPRQSRTAAAALVLWCVAWFALAANLFDRMPAIDAWGVSHFGPVASIDTHQDDSFARWLFYFSPYLRMGEFILGALVAQFYVLMRQRPVTRAENIAGLLALLAAVLSLPCIMYLMYDPHVANNIFRKLNMNFALGPTAAAMIFCAARYTGLTGALNSRPLLALGEASYSIYLTHEIVLVTVDKLLPGPHSLAVDLVKLAAEVGVILTVALLLYKFYEVPTRKWLRRVWADKRATLALAATPAALALVIAGVAHWF